jgi:hypothetical protein
MIAGGARSAVGREARELSNNRQHNLLAVVDFQATYMHLFCTYFKN